MMSPMHVHCIRNPYIASTDIPNSAYFIKAYML